MSDKRCGWCLGEQLYIDYHDDEWGRPCYDSETLFELLSLEGAQAGLSWITILRKRENYRKLFFDFDIDRVSRMRPASVERCLQDPGIVRHRGKIEALISNAKCVKAMQKDGENFAQFLWSFVDYRPQQNNVRTLKSIPSKTSESDAMSKALKKRGFKFCGPTICYAFMQAAGMVNDHLLTCNQHAACKKLGTTKYMPGSWPGRG